MILRCIRYGGYDIHYASRLKTKDKEFHRMLTAYDGVKVISDHYVPSCYMNRNRYMVAQSQCVIAVYDGRDKGGRCSRCSMPMFRGGRSGS